MDFELIAKPTDRIRKMKESFLQHVPQLCSQRGEIVTEVYQKNESLPVILKRSLAFLECTKKINLFIEDGELLLGHHASKPRSAEIYPELFFENWIDEIDTFETRTCNRLKVTEDTKKRIRDIFPYWKGKGVPNLFFALQPREAALANEVGVKRAVSFDGGLGHVVMEYDKLINMGVEGILEEVSKHQSRLDENQPDYFERKCFYEASRNMLNGLVIYANRLAELAESTATRSMDEKRKAELLEMARISRKVPLHKADTFWEAMQTLNLLQFISGMENHNYSMSPCRFDQYMYPFYKKDIERGILTEVQAQELVDDFFLRTCEVIHVSSNAAAEEIAGYPVGELLCVGGVDQEGKDATNDLSYICLTANKHIGLNQPNFAARVHKSMPDLYIDKVIDSIAAGNGMPELLNDELIIDSLLQKGIPLETARDYWALGCDEITVKGHWGRCNGGYINFAKILEVTIGGGTDLLFGKKVGLVQDVDSVKTFAGFMDCFYAQMDYFVKMHCSETNLVDYAHKQLAPIPLVSTFVDGCLQKGKDVTDGGAYLNSTNIVGLGTANCVDGLYSVKELVYDKKTMTLQEFREILKNNYEDQEPLRQMITNKLPKFGNDVDDVDDLAVQVTNHFFDELDKYKTYHNGEFWMALYSVTSQVGMGQLTGAGADGRLARETLADGLTPMYGQDRNGPTASLKSFSKIDLSHAPGGVIVNQRFTSSVFANEKNRKKLAQLFRSFVELGGFHWQFNIVSTDTMRAAQKNPHEYRDLVVRVAGYSAIFIELSDVAQESVIARNAATI